jgi:hypothetical protein
MQNKLAAEKQRQQLQQQQLAASAGSSAKRPKGDAASLSALGGAALGTAELFTPRLKRAKVIVPEGENLFELSG